MTPTNGDLMNDSTTSTTARPLDGLRVIEIASWMAAPSAAVILADMGADVIKVEPPRGDAMRGMIRPARQPEPKVDHAFQADNRGKRSLALDMGADGAREVLHRLVATADILLINLLPRRQVQFGLDPETLRSVRPGLVHTTITGYGTNGPDAERPGYDVTAFFGRSGLYEAQREGDGPPPQARTAQGDHTTGLALTTAVLAALRLAESTGELQVVDVSLYGTALWTQASDLAPVLVDGRQPTRRTRHNLVGALSNRFRCAEDRWVVFNMPEEHWWPRFCVAAGIPDIADDERFNSLKGRFDNSAELVDIIDDALSKRTLDEWGQIFDEHGLIWGPALRYAEVVEDPQAAATNRFPTVSHPHGDFRTTAVPMRIEGAEIGPTGRAPEVGEHSIELLSELGVDDATVEAWLDAGVTVRTPAPLKPGAELH